jgi:hypothetical protein
MNRIKSHLGYDIYQDEQGFYIVGMNGLGQTKRIYRDTLEELTEWISLSFSDYIRNA